MCLFCVQVRDNYRHGVRLDAPPGCPQELLKIMEACWSHNPRNRPSCRGVLRDVNSFLSEFATLFHKQELLKFLLVFFCVAFAMYRLYLHVHFCNIYIFFKIHTGFDKVAYIMCAYTAVKY